MSNETKPWRPVTLDGHVRLRKGMEIKLGDITWGPKGWEPAMGIVGLKVNEYSNVIRPLKKKEEWKY